MKKPPLIASVFTFFAFCVLCALGSWQLQRLAWKEDLLAKIEAAQNVEPSSVQLSAEDFTPENAYARGVITGRFTGPHIPLAPRTYDGQPGYHLYRVFQLEGGGAVLVNQGWAGLEFEVQHNSADMFFDALIGQIQKVEGVITSPPQPNFFTPENDLQAWSWYQIDVPQIQSALDLDKRLAPMIFRAESVTQNAIDLKPLGLPEAPNNNHLQYALFWFSMAGILLIVFYIRFIR